MESKSKVLVIGATGYLGRFMVAASAKAGHPTFALIRESTASNPEKAKTIGAAYNPDRAKTIEDFKNAGVTLVYRFFPAEFGMDVDRVHAVEPAKSLFEAKAKIRRAVEAEGIPYTFVCANLFMSYFPPRLGHVQSTCELC
ncbi:isoflavone reductase-like protein isoform X2 [Cinnamomum micranthum f. kanehirae]|uniref:Isoflavone reductase-like protein isoform X2 n=1 Tax=Cinnamomum micranthum f. kanehirae TaxID=337451 RepID=A0A3S3QAI1_9MAGN|nr:isoflavone reductase-like protein isoform X2 [Cinnamomum micranthum f. kanehirae]